MAAKGTQWEGHNGTGSIPTKFSFSWSISALLKRSQQKCLVQDLFGCRQNFTSKGSRTTQGKFGSKGQPQTSLGEIWGPMEMQGGIMAGPYDLTGTYLGFFGVLRTKHSESLAIGLLYWVIFLTEYASTARDGEGA